MSCQTRRSWLASASSLVARPLLASPAPAATVALARCRTYEPAQLTTALATMFDQIGGLGRIVKNKTVAVKINLTGAPSYRLGHLPAGDTHYTHPQLIAAVVHLMDQAGARRIRLLESPWSWADSVEEYVLQAGWDPTAILSAGARVEFENTNFLGNALKYNRFAVPNGGLLFPAYDLNHSYHDCDAFVSLAKLKEHGTAGITLSMKNCFGIMPSSIYGTGAGEKEPNELPKGGRQIIHSGYRQPSASAPPEKDRSTPRDAGWRVPRAVVDLVAARPIDLAVIDGIKTMTAAEGPWSREEMLAVSPGVLIAGVNCVNTDAVAMAVMGFDPLANRGTPPFENAESTLELAENAGIGSRDLRRIEVAGPKIADLKFDFAAIRAKRPRVAPRRRGQQPGTP